MRQAFLVAFLFCCGAGTLAAAPSWKVIAWNDLGMHCTDGTDYSVFGILPPFNTIHAQVIDPSGRLVRDPSGIRVTYEAVADANGSINTSSIGKTNFWTYVHALFGTSPAPDTGLTGRMMPSLANLAQPMDFDTAAGWFTADGIPITPYDDAGAKNYYPMMRVVLRDAGGIELASTRIVLPVSDEMNCAACHGAGGNSTREDVLRLHDARNASSAYASLLSRAGYKAEGLLATARGGAPILCARCHASNALPGTGYAGVSSLTQAIHLHHATVADPQTGLPLESSSNRDSCYRCHPGATTRCLRGAMGNAVVATGDLAIQCQNCHGPISAVGRPERVGWLEEPTCQSCHTGSASANGGAIRFADGFASPGSPRIAANPIFATNANVPAANLSLFRFSRGHGGLYCEACHGSTHAEAPSSEASDNMQNVQLQGHEGVLGECSACHATVPSSATGGPHGMHPVGQSWVGQHSGVAERSSVACQACHGVDYRGTVLSRAMDNRSLSAFGGRTFWRRYQIGCYACHNGPASESATRVQPPSSSSGPMQTRAGITVRANLQASDPARLPLTLHVVTPPAHGRAGIDGVRVTYVPEPGFMGQDSFTWAAWNGSLESSLATMTIDVSRPGSKRRAVQH